MLVSNEMHVAKFVYDYEVHGGAVGAVVLKPEITPLMEGMIVKDVHVITEGVVNAGGTLTLGVTSDKDGFAQDFTTLIGTKPVFRAGEVAGDLLFDDTNDHKMLYVVPANEELTLDIGTAAVTAGKITVYVECFVK